MLWNDEYLYFAAMMEDPDVLATVTERDGPIYDDNDFEIFMDINSDGRWYYEFEIGGIEYTLPGEEHGYTWALPWAWEILQDGPHRKVVRVQVMEPTTGLRESIDFGVPSGSAALKPWSVSGTRRRIRSTSPIG